MDMTLMVKELRDDEGEKLASYIDTEDYWTIGVGHLIDPKRGANPAPFGIDLRGGKTITADQSAYLLEQDINSKMAQLDAQLPWWRSLSEVRQRVIVNMAFNLGVIGLMGFKNMLAAAQSGNYALAAAAMKASRWASQVGARADRLAAMMVAG
ncbi:MAG: glycoside hydrolase family protein [Alphaproteobacteria bacterium]|nr:glycoside hydrolase family protein [Alphaproteobacteria bacterium]